MPELHVEEPWTPVDTISDFIVQHSLSRPGNDVFNVTPENNIAVMDIFGWLQSLSFDFELVSLKAWCQTLEREGSEQDKTILSFFTRTDNSHDASAGDDSASDTNRVIAMAFEDSRYQSASEALGVTLPAITRELFSLYLEYGTTHQLIPTPIIPLQKQLPAFISADELPTAEDHMETINE
ncbi:hypothetical protein CS022_08640 [Veronia nyctiphanis]|uniref:Uncharacterized protein n=1 Tax=Veronia nyctiphanis TaxID=1278244 RepID=A0A4Q0YSC3_9GAMM|nr:hypothetical protein CS022_08640 [Veronia nyctiphanis]